MFRRFGTRNIEQVLNLKLHQNFSEKWGANRLVSKLCRKDMYEINIIETRPNRIELKLLTNKYRANYNRHVFKFVTVQKLGVMDMAEIDSSTVLYFLVNVVARILKN